MTVAVAEDTAEDTAEGPSPLDAAKLTLVIRGVVAHRRITMRRVSQETGIAQPHLSRLMKHGRPLPAADLLRMLAWLHVDAAVFMTPAAAAPAGPPAKPAAAAPAA